MGKSPVKSTVTGNADLGHKKEGSRGMITFSSVCKESGSEFLLWMSYPREQISHYINWTILLFMDIHCQNILIESCS